MAAMDQGKLDSMVSSITTQHSGYVEIMNGATRDVKSAFDANWVSVSSKELASEISDANLKLATSLYNTFDAVNNSIKSAVANFNATEKENISYAGFKWTIPNTTVTVNAKLPNGKVGVAEGAQLKDIETPVKTMETNILDKLDAICSAVQNSDAFDSGEVSALTGSINNIKNTFRTKLGELTDSLSTRMSGEITQRDELNRVNQQILGGE